MMKVKIGLIFILLILSSIIIKSEGYSVSNTRQSLDDWIITKPTILQDQVKTLNGNLTIMSTGKLILDNVTLVMNCSFDGQYYIEVRSYGELNIINNSTIKSFNSNYRYDFYYLENSKGILEYSKILNAGWDYFGGSHGLFIASDDVKIDNCTLNNNYIDIWCENSNPIIKNNNIITKSEGLPGEHFQIGGINFRNNPSPIIINNYIANSKYGIYFDDASSAIIKNNFFENIVIGAISIIHGGLNPTIENNTIRNCWGGIGSSHGATPYIINNTIYNCEDHGIWIYNSKPTLINNTINNSIGYDFSLIGNSHPYILNNNFNKNNVYFKFIENANPSLTLQWYLKINIIDEQNNSIENVKVIIKNNKGKEIFNDTTDIYGYIDLIICTEYFQQDKNNDTDGNDQGEKEFQTPHNITVSVEYKKEIYDFYENLNMYESKNITMKIDLDNLPPDLTLSSKDILFSNDFPSNGDLITINATINNQGKTKVNMVDIKFYYDKISNENQIGNTQTIMNLKPKEESKISTFWNTTDNEGNHTIFVVIENSNPGELNISNNIAFKDITINPRNHLPIAALVINKTIIFENEEITVDGSKSYDPDGSLEKYYFDFGDGNHSNWISDNILTHRYYSSGSYIITLRVKDNAGDINTNIASVEVKVNRKNKAPRINNISAIPSIIEPNGKSIITVNAFDEDGDILYYIFETNNGTIQGNGPIVTWIAPTYEGKYLINVNVNDGILFSEPEIIEIIVRKNNTIPIIINISAIPEKIEPGGYSIISINAIDLDVNDTLFYFYNSSEGYFTGSGSIITWHAPDYEGIYFITVTVRDLTGEEASDTISIIVQEQQESVEDKNKLDSTFDLYLLIAFILITPILITMSYIIMKREKKQLEELDKQSEEEPIEVEPLEEIENGD